MHIHEKYSEFIALWISQSAINPTSSRQATLIMTERCGSIRVQMEQSLKGYLKKPTALFLITAKPEACGPNKTPNL